MANSDAVSQLYGDSFGNFCIARAQNLSLASTGANVLSVPILVGGLTNGGAVANSGSVIIRRITIQNPSTNISAGNIAVTISPTGNQAAANAVTANTVLSNLTVVGTWQDIAVANNFLSNTAVSGNSTQALYINVNTAVANGTFDIRVYGDVVAF
jgi:hypothetical protein